MRRFVVVGHRAVTDQHFKLDDLAGGAGRLDVLLRCVNSAFFLSHDMRRDTELYLVLQGEPDPPKCLRLVGSELRYLNPDERSTGALVRNALMKKAEMDWTRSTPGIYISRRGLSDVLEELSNDSELVYLREDGSELGGLPGGSATFVLGDDRDLTEGEEEVVRGFGPRRVSLGPRSLHTDHCIVLVHNALDRSD